MAALIRKFIEGYHYVNDDLADPRSVHLPLVATPLGTIAIIIVYNVVVQYLGPEWMKNRKPYNIKWLIVAYDFCQVVINSWMVYRAIRYTFYTGKYSLICQPVETGTSPEEMLIVNTVYYYFLVKILDLVDSVFFVLSKKSSHLSFLHLYHHSGMVFCGWVGVKFVPGGQSVFFGMVNSFVHCVMYAYYLLSALKYLDSKHIFWKRALTQLQMVQFSLIIVHQGAVVLNPSCTFPHFISSMVIPQNVFIFVLFADFYRKAYLKKAKPS